MSVLNNPDFEHMECIKCNDCKHISKLPKIYGTGFCYNPAISKDGWLRMHLWMGCVYGEKE